MKKSLWFGLLLLLATGCKQSATPKTETILQAAKLAAVSAPAASAASEWNPVVKGLPYQLSLKNGLFGFCDDSGFHQMELATGKQTAGVATCDADHEVVQSSCDDTIQIFELPNHGNDHLLIGDYEYDLHGHSGDCDRDGKMVIVSTTAKIELIDGAANKVAIVEPKGGDKVVIGSGWIAWRPLLEDNMLRLETVAKAMEHAATPK